MTSYVDEVTTVLNLDANNFEKGSKKVTSTVEELRGNMRKISTVTEKFNKNGTKTGTVLKETTKRFQRFRMELLSSMFGAMMIKGAMESLLAPAMQMTGMFDLISTVLSVFFLPTALALLDALIPIMNLFLSAPEWLQLAIGGFVLLVAALASVVYVASAMGLFLDQLFNSFVSIRQVFAPFLQLFAGASLGVILAFIAIIAVALVGFWLAWKENLGNIKGWVQVIWQGVKDAFAGIGRVLKGIKDLFVGLFSGDSTKMKEGFMTIISGIVLLFKGLIGILIGLVVTLGISLWVAFKGAFIAIWDLIKEGFICMINWVIDKLNKAIEGINAAPGIEIPKIPNIGSRKTGGYIPHDGLYKLHAGESVNQSNSMNFAPNISIEVGSGVNASELASRIRMELDQQWARQLGNLSRSR